MVDVHLGVNSGRDPGEQHPHEDRGTPSAVKKTRADRKKNGDMSDVSAHSIENTSKIRHPARHSRELSIRRVDNPMKDENGESDKAQPFIVKQRAPGDPDQRPHHRKSDRAHAEQASAARDERAERAEKINVCQLLDLDSFKSEALSENWLVVTGRHKAVASTRFRSGCKP
jgi:hypothetical protein